MLLYGGKILYDMADPLSLAASIAGLVSLSDTVFRHVCKYIRGVKEAREDITKLAKELQSFTGILRSVQSLAQSLEEDGDIYDPTIRVHHVYHCEQTLSKLYTRVKIAAQKVERSRSTVSGSIVQQLKWPFSKSETKEVLGELERHKNNLNLGIGTDSLHKMQLLLSRQKEADIVSSETRSIARELHTKIIVDDRRRKVLEYFTGSVNPQTNLNTNIRARHPMTGLWLTESPGFIQWLDTPGSKLWLSGIPGGGKTVLAGAVIQETLTCASRSDTIGAAFFFCDYQNEHTLQITNIIGALASQLAQQKQEAFDLLQDFYDSLHLMDGRHIDPDPNDLRALVGKISELFSQVYLVVDGIDECGNGMDEVAEILADLATNSCGISIAISSRDEAAIRRQLHANFKQVEVAARAKDLDLYVRAELESLICRGRLRVTTQNLKEEIRQTLVDEAQGM